MKLEKKGDEHCLLTPAWDIRARSIIIATNAYTPENLHPQFKHRFLPVIAHILTTRPLTDNELAEYHWATDLGISTTEGAHHYFRILPDKRLMFGGPGDYTGKPSDIKHSTRRLQDAIRKYFPAWSDIEITHSWRGLVCTSLKFAPSAGRVADDPTMLYSTAYHGNGVAAATWAGRQLAQANASERSVEEVFPSVVLGLKGKIPLPILRPWYLRAAMTLRTIGD